MIARRFRRESTRGERVLWAALKNRQLEGFKFVRQEPIGPFFADFVCREHKLVVEVDGDMHAEEEARRRDARRTAFLEGQGYRVIRFWATDVKDGTDGVLGQILEVLEVKASS